MNEIGLKNILRTNLNIIFKGNVIIFNILITSFFNNIIIAVFIFIKYLLIVDIYIIPPIAMPRNTYNLKLPLLNLNMLYNKIKPAIIQKNISSKYVI